LSNSNIPSAIPLLKKWDAEEMFLSQKKLLACSFKRPLEEDPIDTIGFASNIVLKCLLQLHQNNADAIF